MPTILIDPADLEGVRKLPGRDGLKIYNPEIQSTGFLEQPRLSA
jgi:hypothetical protein